MTSKLKQILDAEKAVNSLAVADALNTAVVNDERSRLAIAAMLGTKKLHAEGLTISEEQARRHPAPRRTMPLTPPEGQ